MNYVDVVYGRLSILLCYKPVEWKGFYWLIVGCELEFNINLKRNSWKAPTNSICSRTKLQTKKAIKRKTKLACFLQSVVNEIIFEIIKQLTSLNQDNVNAIWTGILKKCSFANSLVSAPLYVWKRMKNYTLIEKKNFYFHFILFSRRKTWKQQQIWL